MGPPTDSYPKHITRFHTDCWYGATILRVEDAVEPDYQSYRNRVKIVFRVLRSRGVAHLAHLYLLFGPDWQPLPETEEPLTVLVPDSDEQPLLDALQGLVGHRFSIQFDRPQKKGQKQPIAGIRPFVSPPQRPYVRNWDHYAVLFSLDEGWVKGLEHGEAFHEQRLEEVPPSVFSLLALFAKAHRQAPDARVTTEAYATRSGTRLLDPADAFRKATGKFRDWLHAMDRRRGLGDAVEGAPSRGYVCHIRVADWNPAGGRPRPIPRHTQRSAPLAPGGMVTPTTTHIRNA